MERLEKLYAKLMFRLNTEKRMATARKLASLLRNDFTLMDALGRIEMIESYGGKKPHEPFAIVMREWQKNLERGMSFSDATRGWVPPDETLLVTSGNLSNLVVALENVGRVVDGTQRIRRAMRSAITYPLFLLALTFGIIIMVGVYLVPPPGRGWRQRCSLDRHGAQSDMAVQFFNKVLVPDCNGCRDCVFTDMGQYGQLVRLDAVKI